MRFARGGVHPQKWDKTAIVGTRMLVNNVWYVCYKAIIGINQNYKTPIGSNRGTIWCNVAIILLIDPVIYS